MKLKKLEYPLFEVKYHFGTLFFYKNLLFTIKEKLLNLFIPAPSPKIKERSKVSEIMVEVLKRESLSFKELKLRLKISDLLSNELYKGKYKIVLSFLLPPGSYLIKRLTIYISIISTFFSVILRIVIVARSVSKPQASPGLINRQFSFSLISG